MSLLIHVRLPPLIMQTRKWPVDCKVEDRGESNQICPAKSAMDVHSVERHLRWERELDAGGRKGKGVKGKDGRGNIGSGKGEERESTITRGRLTIADKTPDVGR